MGFFAKLALKQALTWLLAPARIQLGIGYVVDGISRFVASTSAQWDDQLWQECVAKIDAAKTANEVSRILTEFLNKVL